MDPLSSSDGVTFDIKAVIEQTGLDMDEYMEIYELFQENFEELMNDLEIAFEAKNTEKVMHAAHTLKGSTGNIGFNTLSEMAKEIQNDPGNDELVASMLPVMRSHFLKLDAEVRSIEKMYQR